MVESVAQLKMMGGGARVELGLCIIHKSNVLSKLVKSCQHAINSYLQHCTKYCDEFDVPFQRRSGTALALLYILHISTDQLLPLADERRE